MSAQSERLGKEFDRVHIIPKLYRNNDESLKEGTF